MSKQEKVTEQNEQKTMTKYDLKMQRRKEQEEKEKRDKRVGAIISTVVVIALACLVASFPIRNYLAVHETYVEINDIKISKVEYDYNYNIALNNYVGTYGSYLSYFGLDLNSDLSKQMYSDTLTWQDFFDEMAVDSIISEKALRAQADEAGFTFDTDEGFAEFKENAKTAAQAAGKSTADYIKETFGVYATVGRLEPFIRESLRVNAFYDQMADEKAPTDEEARSYYEENKNTFDSVDYHVTTVKAELPTEPTELADPVEETEEAAEGEDATEETEAAYEPSEAEIEKAMADAKELADAAEATIMLEELKENAMYSGTSYLIRDWLFDEARVKGDTTVIEDESGHQYYVVGFEKRYLVEEPTHSARIILLNASEDEELSVTGQDILDEWKAGEATEESFGALADKYNAGTSLTATGGYYSAITTVGTPAEVQTWLREEGRAKGDTAVIDTEEGQTYVVYYVEPNDPEWMLNAKNTLLSTAMEAYLEEISEGFEVNDPKGNLKYLLVQSQESEETTDEETEATADETTDDVTEEVTEETTEE
jgi:hypothetical protein